MDTSNDFECSLKKKKKKTITKVLYMKNMSERLSPSMERNHGLPSSSFPPQQSYQVHELKIVGAHPEFECLQTIWKT